MKRKSTLSYLITVSKAHFMPAQMLILTLQQKTTNDIVVVGNLNDEQASLMRAMGVTYIDENDIDLSGRMPQLNWEFKHRPVGWYKQMFIRHSIDRFMTTDQVVILDSEVFVFDNWDETRFYDSGKPKLFWWTPSQRKPDWDYQMYRGAAYLLSFLPGCEDIQAYASSTDYHRHISGVVLFSTANVRHLWHTLEAQTNLAKNLNDLFNKHEDLAFSDHDLYGMAVEYGLFDKVVPTAPANELLGWYDNHDDPRFSRFRDDAMWSMCQRYMDYKTPKEYVEFMSVTSKKMNRNLPKKPYWNEPDRQLIDESLASQAGIRYFEKYKDQLNHTFRKRYESMYEALRQLAERTQDPVIVEVGTLRDANQGGGHSTYKFGEFCSKFGGQLHTVDILPEAIEFSKKASKDYQPWITYHVQDATEFLKTFDQKIDLLYLDGFDSTPGQEEAASKVQLAEIRAALPHLSDFCLVLLDDTDLPGGGKAKYSPAFLKKSGFALIHDGYQQLYMRDGHKPQGPLGKLKHALRRGGAS